MQFTTLNNGVLMPMQGFGVFQISDPQLCRKVTMHAIQAGYRLIDTASVYGNEKAVGQAVCASGIPRNELFITTKAWISEMGYSQTLKAFEASLERLGLDYLDLYLIHMPFGDYHGAWRALEELYLHGRIRAIGVCNFEPDRLIDLCQTARIIPAVNQVEIHPYLQQTEALQIMQSLGIQAEAWGPLAEGRNNLFSDPVITGIGQKYDKSAAQVVLRWHLQRGIIAIPKSVHPERITENFNIEDFELIPEDMDTLSVMNTTQERILDLHAPREVKRLYSIKCEN